MNVAPEWVAALLGWPVLLAQAFIFGSATLSLIVKAWTVGGAGTGDALARALARWWRILALISFLFAPLTLLSEVAGMVGVSWRQALPFVGEVLSETHAGHVWEWQLPVTLALLLAAWIPMRDAARALMLCLLCTALLLMGSLTSHAIDESAMAVAVHFIHEIAAGLWAGSLFGCWLGARHAGLESRFTVEAPAMLSRLALWSVSVLVLGGIYIAYQGLGPSLDHLLYSDYGRVLMVKLAVFGLVLGVGAYNRCFLMPVLDQSLARRALIRNVGAESLMLVGVLALAALLAHTPPARMAMPTSPARTSDRQAREVWLR